MIRFAVVTCVVAILVVKCQGQDDTPEGGAPSLAGPEYDIQPEGDISSILKLNVSMGDDSIYIPESILRWYYDRYRNSHFCTYFTTVQKSREENSCGRDIVCSGCRRRCLGSPFAQFIGTSRCRSTCDACCSNITTIVWDELEKTVLCCDGYYGRYCDKPKCSFIPDDPTHKCIGMETWGPACQPGCQNGGVCVGDTCVNCDLGFTGKYCEKQIQCDWPGARERLAYCKTGDDCGKVAVCQNNATCPEGQCYCSDTHYGAMCEKPWCPGLCMNGAVCIEEAGGNVCTGCPPWYTGPSCTQPVPWSQAMSDDTATTDPGIEL